MSRKIIIGYQDTPQGHDALALGQTLIEMLNAHAAVPTVPLIATVLPWSRELMGGAELEAALYRETREAFAVATDRVASLEPETRAIANHSASAALYELASDERAPLIVVGSTHRGTLGRVLPGSVGRALLHGAPSAVAVAPRGYADREERRLRLIAIAFDGSSEAWAALETAIALAERTQAILSVLTVVEPELHGPGGFGPVHTATDVRESQRREARRVLDLAASRMPQDLPATTRLLTGVPARRLAESTEGFDLMLAGSRGYGALRRTALGSVSGALVDAAACPVLVLPRAAGMDPLKLGSHTTRAVAAS